MLSYKGYAAKIEINLEAGILHGKVLDINDTVTFEGKTVDDIKREFQKSVDSYLEFCKVTGQEPNKPFQGKIHFRTTPDTHRAISLAAAHEGVSINTWMDTVLKQAAHCVIGQDTDPKPESVIQRLLKQKDVANRLVTVLNPFLESRSPLASVKLMGVLEPLLVGLSGLRPLLKQDEPTMVEQAIAQLHSVLKEMEPADARDPIAMNH